MSSDNNYVVVRIHGTDFRKHLPKLQLIKHSGFFRAMLLRNTWKESLTNEVILHDDNPRSMRLIVELIGDWLVTDILGDPESWPKPKTSEALVSLHQKLMGAWVIADKYSIPIVRPALRDGFSKMLFGVHRNGMSQKPRAVYGQLSPVDTGDMNKDLKAGWASFVTGHYEAMKQECGGEYPAYLYQMLADGLHMANNKGWPVDEVTDYLSENPALGRFLLRDANARVREERKAVLRRNQVLFDAMLECSKRLNAIDPSQRKEYEARLDKVAIASELEMHSYESGISMADFLNGLADNQEDENQLLYDSDKDLDEDEDEEEEEEDDEQTVHPTQESVWAGYVHPLWAARGFDPSDPIWLGPEKS